MSLKSNFSAFETVVLGLCHLMLHDWVTSTKSRPFGLPSVALLRSRYWQIRGSLSRVPRCGGRAYRLGHVGVRKYATHSKQNLFRRGISVLSVLWIVRFWASISACLRPPTSQHAVVVLNQSLRWCVLLPGKLCPPAHVGHLWMGVLRHHHPLLRDVRLWVCRRVRSYHGCAG